MEDKYIKALEDGLTPERLTNVVRGLYVRACSADVSDKDKNQAAALILKYFALEPTKKYELTGGTDPITFVVKWADTINDNNDENIDENIDGEDEEENE